MHRGYNVRDMMSQRWHLTESAARKVVYWLEGGLNANQNSRRHCSSTKCDFRDLEPIFGIVNA